MGSDTLLVNGFYAGAVGHAIEMLHRALGYHLADPDREVSVLLNADTPTELIELTPFVASGWGVRHPLLEPMSDPEMSDRAFAHVPRDWDIIIDDHRRAEAWQVEMFPGLGAYYAASDRRLHARRARILPGDPRVAYRPGGQLRLDVPEAAAATARRRLHDDEDGGARGRPVIVVVPSGSSERSRYPSARSWLAILDALVGLASRPRLVLLGKSVDDGRTTTTLADGERARLLAHRSEPIDAIDLPFTEQVAILEAADLFVAPHTGLGLVALAVDTPWLSVSGGPWFEWFFNRVPFRSILPDTRRFPSFTMTETVDLIRDDGARQPAMSHRRIREDLPRIEAAADELLSRSVSYERAMREYVPALVEAVGGDPARVFSNDSLHLPYLP